MGRTRRDLGEEGSATRGLTAAALAILALAETMIRRPERAEAALSEAAAIVDSLSDEELARHLEAPTRVAGSELYLDRYADGDVHATRALEVARATGQGELLLVLVQTLGGLRRMRGKLAESAELLDGAIEAVALVRQHARTGLEPLRTLVRGAAHGGHRARVRDRSGVRRAQRRPRRGLPLGGGRRGPRIGALRVGTTASRRSSCCSSRREARSSY